MPEQNVPDQGNPDIITKERPEVLMFCGVAGLIGNIVPLITIIWITFIIDHDFVADSIADLAQGPHRRIMDVGFFANAAGLLALAIGSAHSHLGRTRWSLGIIFLALLAMVVTLLGIWDEFGTTASGSDMSVHTALSLLLAPLYLAGPLLMASAIAKLNTDLRLVFILSAVLWLVFAAGSKLAPEAWNGILEKIAIASTLLWTLPLA